MNTDRFGGPAAWEDYLKEESERGSKEELQDIHADDEHDEFYDLCE